MPWSVEVTFMFSVWVLGEDWVREGATGCYIVPGVGCVELTPTAGSAGLSLAGLTNTCLSLAEARYTVNVKSRDWVWSPLVTPGTDYSPDSGLWLVSTRQYWLQIGCWGLGVVTCVRNQGAEPRKVWWAWRLVTARQLTPTDTNGKCSMGTQMQSGKQRLNKLWFFRNRAFYSAWQTI